MRGAHITQSMSENVKITRAETMSQNFRHIVISTHKNVEMSRSETVYFFPTRDGKLTSQVCTLQICEKV